MQEKWMRFENKASNQNLHKFETMNFEFEIN